MKSKFSRFTAMLLTFVMLTTICPTAVFAKDSTDNADSSAVHGYLSDMTISYKLYDTGLPKMYDPDTEKILGDFVFDPEVTEYNLLFGSNGQCEFSAELKDSSVSGLYGRFREITEENTDVIRMSTSEFKYGHYELGIMTASSVFVYKNFLNNHHVDDPVRTVIFEIGKKQTTDGYVNESDQIFEDIDTYTFHIYEQPSLYNIEIRDSSDMDSEPLPTSSYCDEYLTILQDNIDIVYLTAPYNPKNSTGVKLYFKNADGIWTEGLDENGGSVTTPKDTPYKLDLSAYTPDSDGIISVPINLAYEGDGDGIDHEYLLKFTRYQLVPEITLQPKTEQETINKSEVDKITLSTNIAAVPGENAPQGTVTYQWHGMREESTWVDDSAIAGADSSSFTLPNTLYAGDSYFLCEITRKVGNFSFSTLSDLVKITVDSDYSYLSPAEFLEAPKVTSGFSTTCNIGTEPGTFTTSILANGVRSGVFDNPPNAMTPEAGQIWFKICRKPVGSDTDSVEEVGTFRASTSTSCGPNLYAGAYDPPLGIDWKGILGCTAAIPASSTTGTYEYFARLTVTKEGYESVNTDSEVFATVTYTLPDILSKLEGNRSETSPYLIKSYQDLADIRDTVNKGVTLSDIYFALDTDITLPEDWTQIGALKEGATSTGNGTTVNPFSGILNGRGHTITVSKGGKSLFLYTRNAVIRNLNIYGEEINGAGLIDGKFIDYGFDGNYSSGCPNTAELINVTLKSGSKTLGSGLAEGSGSGANNVIVRNCTVEQGVTVGYTKERSNIGSFVGTLNGRIYDSVSYADVKGINHVGGLAGVKGQSMGACLIERSAFLGSVEAEGTGAGGILGLGYVSSSAPATPTASVKNCYVAGNVTGLTDIGGIFGGEPGSINAINPSEITDNIFFGTVTATAEDGVSGGIIGHHANVNSYQTIANNFYLNTGAQQGFGKLDNKIDSFDDSSACAPMTADEFKNGSVLEKLNNSQTSFKNWVQGEEYPVFVDERVATALKISGEFKDSYYIGDELDFSGMTLTVIYNDETTSELSLSDVDIQGYNKEQKGIQTLTFTYGAVSADVRITVLLPESDDITVTVSILGDKIHADGETKAHTMIDKTLTPWVANKSYTVGNNATVWEVLQKVFEENGMTCENPSGNYIQSITYNGETLGEFTNGDNSGWLFMMNGEYGILGISEQYLNPQDHIVFHYTDDFYKEFSGETPEAPEVPDANANASDNVEKIYISAADNILKTTPAPTVSSIGGEWAVLGLARSGKNVPENYYNIYYQNVSDYVKNNINEKEQLHRSRSTDNSRVILALTAIGRDAGDIDGHNLLMGLTDMDYVKRQGINGPVWALLAFDSHNYEIPVNKEAAEQTEREKLISCILEAQLSNGGWSLDEDKTDIDITAMAVQALAPYYNKNTEVKASIDRALNLLSYLQGGNGGFTGTYGAGSESCSQVITALTALGINPETDERFIKNGCSVLDALCTYAVDNGFCHTAGGEINAMATEQGYYALAAYFRFMENKTSLYDMSDVTITKNTPNDKDDDVKPNPPQTKPDDENHGNLPAQTKPDNDTPDNPPAQTKPDDNGTKVSGPKTGDSANTFVYISLLLLSLSGAALTTAYKRRKG